MPPDVLIRGATADDWPAIWPFLRAIVAAGETYTWDRDVAQEQARSMWFGVPAGHVAVAVDENGTVLGTAKMGRNQQGPGAHVATASFMVDPARAGRGVGRALGEYAVEWAREQGFQLMQFNAVVETNTQAVALWRSLDFHLAGTIPGAFHHPTKGYVGLHVMYRDLTA